MLVHGHLGTRALGRAGAEVRRQKAFITQKDACGIVLLALLPDVLQLAPALGWVAVGDGSIQALYEYAFATPGAEPAFPPTVQSLVHHIHCAMHSAIVASALTLLVWVFYRPWSVPLLGWWSHIMIDVFSHSKDYYPVPVLYPITYRGFDGVAWNSPTFMLLNYLLLAAIYLWLLRTRNRTASEASVSADGS